MTTCLARWATTIGLIVAISFGTFGNARAVPPSATCAQRSIPIDGNQIWVDIQGNGPLTVVFEAGFGNESSVWANITPRVRLAGVRTLVYDRAGMGKSLLTAKTHYSIEHDADTLQSLLSACGVQAPVILVGHSYGGAIGLLDASHDRRVAGIVLIDAMVPHAYAKSEIDANVKEMRAQYEDILIEAPNLARVAIPFAESFAITNQKIDQLQSRTPCR